MMQNPNTEEDKRKVKEKEQELEKITERKKLQNRVFEKMIQELKKQEEDISNSKTSKK